MGGGTRGREGGSSPEHRHKRKISRKKKHEPSSSKAFVRILLHPLHFKNPVPCKCWWGNGQKDFGDPKKNGAQECPSAWDERGSHITAMFAIQPRRANAERKEARERLISPL